MQPIHVLLGTELLTEVHGEIPVRVLGEDVNSKGLTGLNPSQLRANRLVGRR